MSIKMHVGPPHIHNSPYSLLYTQLCKDALVMHTDVANASKMNILFYNVAWGWGLYIL